MSAGIAATLRYINEGIDDNDRLWHEAVTGRGQESWLLKQLYVERRFGRRNRIYDVRKKVGK